VPGAVVGDPSWSPDGKRIAFSLVSGEGKDQHARVWVAGVDGGDMKNLTANQLELWNFDPVWSPDGSKIAYVAGTGHRRGELWVLNVDGSGASAVMRMEWLGNPAWSRDGSMILFEGRSLTRYRALWKVNADGRGLMRLAGGGAVAAVSGTWSPNGTRIAYAVVEPGEEFTEIWTMIADGSRKTQLTRRFKGGHTGPVWSPQGP
jgi:Tol biopolymer transport system component